jgi:hypothetical protein
MSTSPARAQSWNDVYWYESRPKPRPKPKPKLPALPVAEKKEPFGDIPKGPLQIIISIDQQKLHLYSDGNEVAETLIATGVPEHPTPMGVFSVIQKDLLHHSNIYSGAPMPFMQRITWSGVALHEGVNLGHPASHGCIRMPRDFASRLWLLTRLGVRVVIARPELHPSDFADTRLFVHVDEPSPSSTAAAPAIEKRVNTAPTVAEGKASDASTAKADDGAAQLQEAVRAASAAVSAKPVDVPPDIVLRRTIGADPPTQVAGDQVVPTANDVAPSGKPAAVDNSATTPAAAAPLPPTSAEKPSDMAIRRTPISIFVSAKEKKIFVRQDFVPLFSAPITIENPDKRLGTHIFTAMEFLGDHSSFRWNVISLPPEPAKVQIKGARTHIIDATYGKTRHEDATAAPLPQSSAQEALARLDIPQDIIERISQLIVPGSSFIVSDQGLGGETGNGTDFIIINH